ncbi:prephenate dehydratase domain-containing protein [Chelativorans xinjiangense]|uniref:prephenate dehydratase domain-containing protein n=1 Tax=Chelativorans xinjiangense TaxID=2681485 RepID=UPI00135AFD21|nr:prephenate dehydratase domain-containing protein [Chelativorans xinjiangense]
MPHSALNFDMVRPAKADMQPDLLRRRPRRSKSRPTVAYHGKPGAFVHIACSHAFANADALPFESTAEAVAAVHAGTADALIVPCENLLAGRVPDIHLLLPESGLHIIGEHYERIELHIAARHGTTFEEVRRVYSHPVALQQVRCFLTLHGLQGVGVSNTAAAAAYIAESSALDEAAVASREAAHYYGLQVLRANIEDSPHNITRFYILATEPSRSRSRQVPMLTTVLFAVENRPGSLHDAIEGFGRHQVNLTRLESYLVDGGFVATRFLCEFEGDPRSTEVRSAVEHLSMNCTSSVILGTYPANPTRPQPSVRGMKA